MRRGILQVTCLLLLCTHGAHAALSLSGGGLALIAEGGTLPADNLAEGGTPFAKDVIAGFPNLHSIAHLNDRNYGNGKSWIGGSTGSFSGISLGDAPVTLNGFAFGRDNTGGFTDRTLGLYTLQYTTVPNPGAATPGASWTTIGTLDFGAAGGANYASPSRRHRFQFTPVSATGLRLLVPDSACIDEFEIFGNLPVTTAADELDTPAGAYRSLREALRDVAAGGTIVFHPSLSGQTNFLSAAYGELVVSKSLQVSADSLPEGFHVRAGPEPFRVMRVNSLATVTLRRLSLSGGRVITNGTGGGILCMGNLTLIGCVLHDNQAYAGGGLYAEGTGVTLENCSVHGNQAANGFGGGLALIETPLLATRCTLQGNSVLAQGGAISIHATNPLSPIAHVLNACTITGNSAGTEGGGIHCQGSFYSLLLRNSVIAGNTNAIAPDLSALRSNIVAGDLSLLGSSVGVTGFTGAGFLVNPNPGLSSLARRGGFTPVMIPLANSPARDAGLAGGTATDQRGYGLVGPPDLGAAEAQLGAIGDVATDEDTAPAPLAFTVGQVGALVATSSVQSVVADAGIVVGGSGANRTVTVTPVADAFGSTVITLRDPSGETESFTLTVNAVNDPPSFTPGPNLQVTRNSGLTVASPWATNIQAGPANESGQILSFALLQTAGDDVLDLIEATPGQLSLRPKPHVSGQATYAAQLNDSEGGVSLVAYFQVTVLPYEVVNEFNSGAGSLRQAIFDAAAIPGANTIQFDPALSGKTIRLNAVLNINDPGGVTLDAGTLPGGLTLSGRTTSQIVFVTVNSLATLNALTLADGASSNNGGAVQNSGMLTLRNCTLHANRASFSGGAIRSAGASATLLMENCTLTANRANHGAALLNEAGSLATLRHCTIAGNTGLAGNGGITADSPVTLTACVVAGNTGPGSGSAVNLGGTAWTADTSLISGDPLLAPLGWYGGLTPTMAPRPGSPALDGAAGSLISTDQRGFPRVGIPDMGAHEAGTHTDFDVWVWETLPATALAGQLEPGDDFDGDGRTLLAEYASLGQGNGPDAGNLTLSVNPSGTFATLTLPARLNSPDLRIVLEGADSLAGPWTALHTRTTSGAVNAPGVTASTLPNQLQVTAPIPLPSQLRYYRARFESL